MVVWHYGRLHMQRMALYLQDEHPIEYELEVAGVRRRPRDSPRSGRPRPPARPRLRRADVRTLDAHEAVANRIRSAADLDAQPPVIAATWSTMWELAGRTVDGQSRVMCGIGAWWEPIREPREVSSAGIGR